MKHESGVNFHMIMKKGDSVLVSGFSFIDTDEQMQAVHTEDDDTMLYHVITVGGDTTQGNIESYFSMFTQITVVKSLSHTSKQSVSGSGFRSTVCVFGLMWVSHLANTSCDHYITSRQSSQLSRKRNPNYIVQVEILADRLSVEESVSLFKIQD